MKINGSNPTYGSKHILGLFKALLLPSLVVPIFTGVKCGHEPPNQIVCQDTCVLFTFQ